MRWDDSLTSVWQSWEQIGSTRRERVMMTLSKCGCCSLTTNYIFAFILYYQHHSLFIIHFLSLSLSLSLSFSPSLSLLPSLSPSLSLSLSLTALKRTLLPGRRSCGHQCVNSLALTALRSRPWLESTSSPYTKTCQRRRYLRENHTDWDRIKIKNRKCTCTMYIRRAVHVHVHVHVCVWKVGLHVYTVFALCNEHACICGRC